MYRWSYFTDSFSI